MVDGLVGKGYFDDGFKERLLERAAKGSMVFDRYIALPHTTNTATNKIELALGIFPEKVLAEGKEIKLVFLLGIPKQTDYDASFLVKIYDEIMKIAANEQLVDQLARSTSYEEIAKNLEYACRS
jgi:lichenan operon transcriptional antiterminator